MSRRRLPPLNALRGFEAAARHLSFTKAAAELLVTQGAVSRQIRDLEVHLGQALFRRLTRRVELTPDGERFHRVVEDVFDELERAAGRFRPAGSQAVLTISVLPTIASLWLMPRLHLFTQARREVDVRIVSSIGPADLGAQEADIAIRVGRLPGRRYDRSQPRIELDMVTSWDGVHAEELFPDVLVPVCAPSLAPAGDATPADLARMTLIHTSSRRHAWPDWLRAQGVRMGTFDRPPLEFGHFFMSLEAARKGQGVAIIPDVILAHYEGANELVTPLRTNLPSAGEYYLLIHESRLDDPKVQVFRSWLLGEALNARRHVAGAPVGASFADG